MESVECVLSSSECRCWGLMLSLNQAQLAHRHQACDPAASITPQLLSAAPLFFLPLTPQHFLFLTLSQALKGLLVLVFLLWFSLSAICPPSHSSLGNSPFSLCEPRNSRQLHFPSFVLPSSSFCLCARRESVRGAQPAKWHGLDPTETAGGAKHSIHAYSSCFPGEGQPQLDGKDQAQSLRSIWESPELRAPTSTFTTGFVEAEQLHFPCMVLLLLCADFLLLQQTAVLHEETGQDLINKC